MSILLQSLYTPIFQGEKRVNIHYLYCYIHSLHVLLFSYRFRHVKLSNLFLFQSAFFSTWSSFHSGLLTFQFSVYRTLLTGDFQQRPLITGGSCYTQSILYLSSQCLPQIFDFVSNGVFTHLLSDTSLVCKVHENRDPSVCSSSVSPALHP